LDPSRAHLNLISELFGCDIALYPAHLATLNLAAREINEEANYPRIVRQDFFEVAPNRAFCRIPDGSGHKNVMLPLLDAVVGNPPYVRQEKIEKELKEHYAAIATSSWPGLKLSGRSDLYCYFWPGAFLAEKEGVAALFDVIGQGLPEFFGQPMRAGNDHEREFPQARLELVFRQDIDGVMGIKW